jgi:hypothetical protein
MAGEKGQSFSTGLLQAIFTATFSNAAVVHLLANSATGVLTNLYVALHTADPVATGSQSTNEVAYTSYARVAVARTTGGFTVGTATVSPAATVSFPACTGLTATATHWSIGTDSSGAGNLLYAGPISPTIAISTGVTPQLTTASTITEA